MAQGQGFDPGDPPLRGAWALAAAWVVAAGLMVWFVSGGAGLVVRLVVLTVVALGPVAAFLLMLREIGGLRAQIAALAARRPDPPRPDTALPDTTGVRARPAPPVATGFASRREVSRMIVPRAAPAAPPDQPSLALDPPAADETPPLRRADLIRALNFPEDQNDAEGFAALRRALRDRGARHLVQASQDVLTLLSQDGVYMDDLRPDPASADLWRRFAKGERGRSMDGLGAVRDHAALTTVSVRMREDTIFRDAVHHFMRRFDQILIAFEDRATDTDLLALGETRTARAFMLLGRAQRTFD